MLVSVPERGSVPLSGDEWAALSSQASFWQLIDSGIVSLEAKGGRSWSLRGSCYVGRAVIGSAILEVHEKVSGAFETLVSLSSTQPDKSLKIGAPTGKASDTTLVLVNLFLEAAREYLSGRRATSYRQVAVRGALIGGSLDISGTIRLRTKGTFHQAAFYRTELTSDVPFNQCIYAALRQVERLGTTAGLSQRHISTARTLSMALADCAASVINLAPNEILRVVGALSVEEREGSPRKDVIQLAQAIMEASGFAKYEAWTGKVHRSWFVNLEVFFERAIRQTVGHWLAPDRSVSSAKLRPSLFSPPSGRYRANPDAVLYSAERVVISIADAKYKEFSGWPGHSDVFEILSHAQAYASRRAILFYPTENEAFFRALGKTNNDCELWACGISFDRFALDVLDALKMASIVP